MQRARAYAHTRAVTLLNERCKDTHTHTHTQCATLRRHRTYNVSHGFMLTNGAADTVNAVRRAAATVISAQPEIRLMRIEKGQATVILLLLFMWLLLLPK